MSSTPNKSSPLTWTGRKGKSQITAPDPNAGRADDYPNEWRIEFNKQTAKCMICARHLAGTKYCVVCVKCNKRICVFCWNGERFNRYDEKIFEGEVQNQEGCWCRFPANYDPKWQAASDARTERMQKLIAEEQRKEALEREQEPVAKKLKLDHDDGEKSPTRRMVRPEGITRQIESGPKGRAGLQANPSGKDTLSTTQNLQAEQSRKDSQIPAVKHLQNKTTVIVGAGVIGLSIARELACHAYYSGTEHEIIVVEARDKYAELASHDCAGLITKHGVPKAFKPLLDASLNAWEHMLAEDEIREKVQFQPHGAVHVKQKFESKSPQTAAPPSWVSDRPEDIYTVYERDVGKISTRQFAEWLYQECDDLGVQFRFHQEVTAIEKTKQAQLLAVDIGSTKEGDDRWINIPCHNLILAAGPWTPSILRVLAMWLPDLDNFQQRYEWTRIRHSDENGPNDNVGLMLRSSTYTEGTLLSNQADTKELLIAVVRGEQNNSHVTPTEARSDRKPSHKPTSKSRILAKQRIQRFDEGERDANANVVDGRSLISTSFNQLPLIDKVPAKLLDERHEGKDVNPLGIYLAFGFGRFGTTLAPGVADILRRMICRDEGAIGGEEAFAFPVKRK